MFQHIFLSQYIRIGGWILAVVGFALTLVTANAFFLGEKVEVQVASIGLSTDSDGNKVSSPTFIVMSGEFEGKRFKQSWTTYPPLYSDGDVVDGKYDPWTGMVMGDDALWSHVIMAVSLVFMGLFCALLLAPFQEVAQNWKIFGPHKWKG